ncbi:MAG: hypothetical protein NPIRA05_01350 [Nitrospirales bacterium]|nr:MAG: hypothetical protein NPIRA05_01350 [Nitrospirales bacterium]
MHSKMTLRVLYAYLFFLFAIVLVPSLVGNNSSPAIPIIWAADDSLGACMSQVRQDFDDAMEDAKSERTKLHAANTLAVTALIALRFPAQVALAGGAAVALVIEQNYAVAVNNARATRNDGQNNCRKRALQQERSISAQLHADYHDQINHDSNVSSGAVYYQGSNPRGEVSVTRIDTNR